MENGKLDINTLEGWLWEAACKIRGDVDAPKYKDYILPIIFLKRLSDVFDDEISRLAKEYKDEKTAKQNPKLAGVIDSKDFNETASGQRVISDEKLKLMIDTLNRYRLGLKDVEPDILGRAYEYLLRKFAEGSGQSAGEFYTPREVAILMANVLDPKEGEEVYDPCLGSGGLLIKSYLRFKEKYLGSTKIKPIKFFGQEYLHSTYAMAKMNAFIHQMQAEIALGDTMNQPAFTDAQSRLRKFNIVVANPMWNQDFPQATYEADTYNRFCLGIPPSSSADWGWIQHMFASLNDKGRMAVILDTGSVSRGSGNKGSNRERDIRKKFVEKDFIEAVILVPDNLFYNTTAPGVILVINREKKHTDKILLINASKLFKKGRPKNYLPDEYVDKISSLYLKWKEEEGISKVIEKEEIVKNDYNLSPSRYVAQNGEDETLPLDEAVVLVKEAEEERAKADEKLRNVLGQLGFE